MKKTTIITIALFSQFCVGQSSFSDRTSKNNFLKTLAINFTQAVFSNAYSSSFPMGEISVNGETKKLYANSGFLIPINENGISEKSNWRFDFGIAKIYIEEGLSVMPTIAYSRKSIAFYESSNLTNFSTKTLGGSLLVGYEIPFYYNKFFNGISFFGGIGYDFKLSSSALIENKDGVISKGDKNLFNGSTSYRVFLNFKLLRKLNLATGYMGDFNNLFKNENYKYKHNALFINLGITIF